MKIWRKKKLALFVLTLNKRSCIGVTKVGTRTGCDPITNVVTKMRQLKITHNCFSSINKTKLCFPISARCCDEGKFFVREFPDSPAAIAYKNIVGSKSF